MPWSVKTKAKGCDGFAVVKDGTNTPIPGGCHKTRPAALKHLLALRLSYDERANPDQPRDPDGKFASGGGGGSPSDSGGKGGGGTPKAPVAKPPQPTRPSSKAGSRMKPAPANVTSKGVNPDAEYVRSVKTGNVFKNPQYNGNPNGAGKYADNGKVGGAPKPIGGRIDEMEGGAKFQQTGQSKHKDDGTGPRTPSPRPQPAGVSKTGLGKTPPKYIKGKKLDPKDPEGAKKLEEIRALGVTRKGGGDPFLYGVAEAQGFTGKPLVVTEAEGKALEEQGWQKVWRGTSKDSSGRSYSEEFATGEYYPGLGIYGNGTYTATSGLTAESYSQGGKGGLNEIFISPDARTITEAELQVVQRTHSAELTRESARIQGEKMALYKQAAPSGRLSDLSPKTKADIDAQFKERERAIETAEIVLYDRGVLAASLGYDAIQVVGVGSSFRRPKGGGKPVARREDYFVILNRTAVATRVVRP